MPLRKMVDPVVRIIFSLSLLRDNVMKPDVEKENECLSAVLKHHTHSILSRI